MKTDYQATYWVNHGRYQSLNSALRARLVPKEGEAETRHGEILRIASILYYDVHNNGGCNFKIRFDERRKLYSLVPATAKKATERFITVPPKNWMENGQYQLFLDLYMDWVIMYVSACEALEKL